MKSIHKSLFVVQQYNQLPHMANFMGNQRKRAYNTEEREIIDVYKPTYLKAATAGERKGIAQQVLVDIFNYWSKKGLQFTSIEVNIKTKVCGSGTSRHVPY
jgi:hypothetical protein